MTKQLICIFVLLLLLQATTAGAQGNGIGTTAPHPSAILDLSSNSQGLLAPRMTAAERAAIQNPAKGLLVYQTDSAQSGLWCYNGSSWNAVAGGGAADNMGNHIATQNVDLAGFQLVGNGGANGLYISNTGNIGAGVAAPANLMDLQAGQRTGTHATGRALYVTGDFDQAANGVEFRHMNGTQGIGIGYNSIYGTGTDANQHVNIMPRGTGGVGIGTLAPQGKLDVGSGSIRFPAGASATWFNYTDGRNYIRSTTIMADEGNGSKVAIGTNVPAATAILDVSATDRGFLPPRLNSAQRDAIAGPAEGLTIYNTVNGRLNFYDGAKWAEPLLTTDDGVRSVFFSPTGSPQTFTVPAGVSSISVDMTGAAGTASGNNNGGGGARPAYRPRSPLRPARC